MDLPNLFFRAHTKLNQSYLSLAITSDSIQAFLWQIEEKIQLIKQSLVFPYHGDEQLIIKADQALSELGAAGEKVNEVVLALENSWVNKDGILPEKKELIKKLVKDLSLTAIGFVVMAEAVVEELKKKQPSLNTLLLMIEANKLNLLLIQQGKILKIESVARSDDTGADFTEALARLQKNHQSTLPSNITLAAVFIEEEELVSINQALTVQSKAVINNLDTDFLATAIVQHAGKAVAQQSGVSTSFGVPIKSQLPAEKIKEVEITPEEKKAPAKRGRLAKWWRKHYRLALLGFSSGLISLLILAVLLISFASQATITIVPQSRRLSQDIKITLSPSISESDFSKLILKAETTSAQVTVNKVIDATGVKLIGDRAKGKVSLLNKTSGEKTLAAGTKISQANLIFTLDEEVTIASASENANHDGIEYGKKETPVSAVDIGAQYNLATGQELKVADFDQSSYAALVADGLTGGSSREIRVVSQADQDELLAALKEEAVGKAATEFKEKSSADKQYLPTGQIKIISSEYDQKVGAESKTMELNLTAEVTAVAYLKEDLKPLAEFVLSDSLPEGYQLAATDPEILSDSAGIASGAAITIAANLSSNAIAQIDEEKIKQGIAGQNLSQAKNFLTSLAEIKSFVLTLNPRIMEKIRPQLPPADRIKIELSP